MRACLLDTNVFIRWIAGSVPQRVKRRLQKSGVELFVSIVTPWEIAMKSALRVPELSATRIKQRMVEMGARLIPITLDHIELLSGLPPHHNDPFDRMIIAQALSEDCLVVSADERFPLYEPAGLKVLWD
jgi:PIN domain nuclease of toxin-antitoxin system